MIDINEAKRVLKIEAESVLNAVERIGENFIKSVELILNCEGKLIVTGMGKSGQVGQKIASTFSSTGTPAMFLSSAESVHGDLGVIAKNDLILAISYGGESGELAAVVQYAGRKNIPLIAMTGRLDSTLGKASQAVIDVSVKEEACPLGLAPTSSSTVTLAMGDAMAMTVLKAKGFKEENFAEYHPGGSLGRRLLTTVKDVMHTGEALPIVSPEDKMSEVISSMTSKEVRGVAGVVDSSGELLGVITDGDIRRFLEKENTAPSAHTAKRLMNLNPKTINKDELAEKALFVMEQFSIQTLFVVDKETKTPNKPIGLIHLQDLLKAKIR